MVPAWLGLACAVTAACTEAPTSPTSPGGGAAPGASASTASTTSATDQQRQHHRDAGPGPADRDVAALPRQPDRRGRPRQGADRSAGRGRPRRRSHGGVLAEDRAGRQSVQLVPGRQRRLDLRQRDPRSRRVRHRRLRRVRRVALGRTHRLRRRPRRAAADHLRADRRRRRALAPRRADAALRRRRDAHLRRRHGERAGRRPGRRHQLPRRTPDRRRRAIRSWSSARPRRDDGAGGHGFSGALDELRLSSSIRYSSPFDRPIAPFTADAETALLFHFDEGPAGPCLSSVVDTSGRATHGQCRHGGSATPGPLYEADAPFLPPRQRPGSSAADGKPIALVPADGSAPAPTPASTPRTPSRAAADPEHPLSATRGRDDSGVASLRSRRPLRQAAPWPWRPCRRSRTRRSRSSRAPARRRSAPCW